MVMGSSSFRWLTLMLSQEFPLPDVLRIWDSLLSDETRSDFLIDVCTAMILVIRDEILINDFADNSDGFLSQPGGRIFTLSTRLPIR